jgi:DNA-binding CsgD family transcriptional regulator
MFWNGGRGELYGRAGERELIQGFLTRVQHGGDAVVLHGQPGVGTTALLDLARDLARSAGLRVIEGSGAPLGPVHRLSGLRQVLEQLFTEVPARQAAAVRTQLEVPGPPAAVGTVVATMLRAVAARNPVLLNLDDGIEPDPLDLAVWAEIITRVQGTAGLGILGVGRPEHRARFDPAVRHHDVRPLAEPAARLLLAHRHPGLAGPVTERVLREAAGNPLALEELPLHLEHPQAMTGTLLPRFLPFGERMRATFERRLAPLPERTRDLLLLHAVDSSGSLPVWSGTDTGPGRVAALRPALEAQLIACAGDDQVRFTHPLIGTALVDLATAQQRSRAHEIWARALENEDPERSTYHRAEATLAPDEDVALALDAQAARSWQRGHERGALEAARAAARLSPDPDERGRRLVGAAYSGVLSGRLDTAGVLLTEARKAHEGVTGSVAEAAVAAFLLLNGDGDVDLAHRLLTTAIDAHRDPGDSQDGDLVRAVRALFAVCILGNRADLWDDFRRIVDAMRPPQPETLGVLRVIAELGSGRIVADNGVFDRALTGSASTSPEHLAFVASSALLIQRTDELFPVLEKVVPTVHGGTDGIRTQLDFFLSYVAMMTGQWDEALVVARDGLERLNEPGQGLTSWSLTWIQAQILAVRGDAGPARSLARAVLHWATPRKIGAARDLAYRVFAAVAMAEGDYEEAFRHLTLITPIGSLAQYAGPPVHISMDLVQAAMRTDRQQLAGAHVRALQEARIARLSPFLAMLVDAAAALAAGDHSSAAGMFEQALRPGVVERWPYEGARIRLAYGEYLRRRGAVSRSRQQLTAARDLFAALGADPWTRRALNELRAAGAGDRPALARAGASERLSPQELQIARLAASGLSNKQIGERLFLSPRTVGNHLHRAFPKLEVTSRAGLRDALVSLEPSIGVG